MEDDMPYKIVMTMTHVGGVAEEARKIGAELSIVPCTTEEEVLAVTRDADAVITGLECPVPYNRNVISKLEKCRIIHNIGAGYERIDVPAATDYGICVSYPADYCAEEVAEHSMTLLFACARRLTRLNRAVRQGKWSFASARTDTEVWLPMFRIAEQTLGIIGFGRVGRLIVPKAKGFGMRVIAHDRYVPAEVFEQMKVDSASLDEVISQSDYVIISAALTKETFNLVGAEQFRKMKPTAYLINCARAELADEDALINALKDGQIAGAGLDVVRGEAITPNHPILQFDNVIVTGHSAWYSERSVAEIKTRPYINIGAVFNGGWPKWFINPEVKDKYLERWGKA
jgi:D-3-phosphoglycerate dehydrogenase